MSYREEIREAVEQYIEDNKDEILEALGAESMEEVDQYDLDEYLRDQLWTEDSVTGNGSGSYTMDREEAKEKVLSALDYEPDTVEDAFNEFASAEALGRRILEGEWEYIDVTIRCYLLGEVIAEVVKDI